MKVIALNIAKYRNLSMGNLVHICEKKDIIIRLVYIDSIRCRDE